MEILNEEHVLLEGRKIGFEIFCLVVISVGSHISIRLIGLQVICS